MQEFDEKGIDIVHSNGKRNFYFVIRDAIQGYHWIDDQATIHPSLAYFVKDGALEHFSFIVISDSLNHDRIASTFSFNFLMNYLKTKFISQKIYYFSDGCTVQYKHRKKKLRIHCLPPRWHRTACGMAFLRSFPRHGSLRRIRRNIVAACHKGKSA